MPSSQDLEQLKGAMATLSRLGAARGGLIRAEDWNALVATVVDLARTFLGRDGADVVPPHEHRDQVTAEWLAPALRALVERGPLADPTQVTRLADVELGIKRLRDTADTGQAAAVDLRARLDAVTTRDLERQAAVTRVTRAIDSVADPKPELDAMRASLKSVQDNLSTVVDAASKLRDATGQGVDLAALNAKVNGFDELAARLRGADGQVLDFAGIENRLAAIAEKSVTQDQLTTAITNARNARPAGLDEVEARLSASLHDQFQGSLTNLKDELSVNINNRLGGLDALVDARVTGALPGVAATLGAAIDARANAARDAAVAAAATASDQGLTAQAAALRAEIAAGLDSVNASTRGLIQDEVGRRVAADLAATSTSLASANARLDAFAAGLADEQRLRADQGTALAAVPQLLAALRTELRDTLIGEADTRANATRAAVDAQLAALAQQQQQTLAAMTRQINQTAVDAARAAAAEAAQSEVKAARVSILAEVRGIAREEVSVGVRNVTNVNTGGLIRTGVIRTGGPG